MSRWVLLGICLLFGTFVVLQLWPGRRRRRADAGPGVREARARASAATSPEARAAALADAADGAVHHRRWTSAAGLYLRALRAHPAGVGIAPRLVASLGGRRPRLTASILWRRLAALPDDEAHRAAAADLTASLAALYERRRDRPKAEVLRRQAERLARPRA